MSSWVIEEALLSLIISLKILMIPFLPCKESQLKYAERFQEKEEEENFGLNLEESTWKP